MIALPRLSRHPNLPRGLSSPRPRTSRPPRALRARVSPRLAAHNTAPLAHTRTRDRLLAFHEASRHVGPTRDTDHAADSVVCEGDPDARERQAEVSRGLAADDAMRDDSHFLSFFFPVLMWHSQSYDKALSRTVTYVSLRNVEDAIKLFRDVDLTRAVLQ